jgi:tetratricopeptide (TPR) repeat protein
VLERAAVVGRDFPVSALASLTDPGEPSALTGTLMSLVRKGLIEPGKEDTSEDRFTFQHVLIRDAAYEAIPKELRAELHERLADWCAESGDELVGYHLEQAYKAGSEIAPSDPRLDELARRAVGALVAAGRRAQARDDIPAALNLLDRAAILLAGGRDDALRAELLVDLGSLMMSAGRFDDAVPLWSEAEDLAASVGDRRLQLRIEVDRTHQQIFTDASGLEVLDGIAEKIVPELEALGDDLGLARAWFLLSEEAAVSCRWKRRQELLERGLLHARKAGDRRVIANLTGSLTFALVLGPTPVDIALRKCEELLPDSREGALRALAALSAMRGDFEAARREWEEAAAFMEEFGLRYRRAAGSIVAAEIETLAGEPDAAVRALRWAESELEEMGERGLRSTIDAYLAQALCDAGRWEEAYEVSETSERFASADDLVTETLWRCARARVLAEGGELEAADELSAAAEELASPTEFPDLQAAALLARARVLSLQGKDEEARMRLERARGLYEQKGNVVAARRTAELLTV